MIPYLLITTLLMSSLSTAPSMPGTSQRIELHVSHIRSSKGNIRVGVFLNNESFKQENPAQRIEIPKTNLVNGSIHASLDLPPGVYGLSLLDDENGNGKMDFNMVGWPLEGFGFSNYYHTGFTKPNFTQFQFKLAPDGPKQVEVSIRYM
ncbi:MAG: DUF2141 domain-containing protein [Bacteroidia bacterium]|nr:DUF2141 domain-containing protein [Bacteroidia bacterium]